MRRATEYYRTIHKSLLLLFLVIFISLIVIPSVKADIGENLEIELDMQEVDEENYFSIAVFDPEDDVSLTPYLIDVTIQFNNEEYFITSYEEITLSIKAPKVDSNTMMSITATKDGYNPDSAEILVKDTDSVTLPKLVIEPQSYILSAGEQFWVKVTDEDEALVANVRVYIQSSNDAPVYTNDEGIAILVAPKDRDAIKIYAEKDGYTLDTVKISIEQEEDILTQIINNPYFIIICAIILLVFVIFFVNYREKKNIFERTKEITMKKKIEQYGNKNESTTLTNEVNANPSEYSSLSSPVRAQTDKTDSKVEEIRITRPRKEKEIVPVKTVEDKTNDIVKKKHMQKKDYDWFEGKDDMRYEINKLTGEVDEEVLDKWYEGGSNIKDKIDEKVKNKDKKKKEKS